jgi:uncharacterized membrane protein
MNNSVILKSILLPGIVLLILDGIALNFIAILFRKQISDVQNSQMKVNIYGAIIAYLFLIVAISYFIILPKKGIVDAMILGAVIYGVYEGTSYALLKNWKISTVIVDTLWGGVLFGLTTFITYYINKLI